MKRILLILAPLILMTAPPAAKGETFPVPDIIKDNVAFWIRIYTEVSLQEGLLHDREHPQIVYENVKVGNRTGKARTDYIGARRKIYTDAIIAVRDSAPDKLGVAERRVAELFKLAPEGAITDAENRIRFQTGQRERFLQGLERSAIYLDTISAILKMHGIPDELKYLPHVESSFNPGAYSKVGAAGLWQFMRATGRQYNMRIDNMIDQRSDPIVSSHAAARFLRANYNMLQSWPLAITAYNHGPNGIRRAVESVGSREIVDILEKHESPTFKFASKNFYSCFIAVLQIMEDPNKYFNRINYRPRYSATSVQLPFAIKPNVLCRTFGISEQLLGQMNPSLRPIMFRQQHTIPAGFHVNLPDTISAEQALIALGERTPTLPPISQPQRVTISREITAADGYYTVMQGDNLNNIARSLGVSMTALAAENNITNASRIYVGQVLRIPARESAGAPAQTQAAMISAPTATATIVAMPDTAVSAPTVTETISAVPDTIAPAAPVAVSDCTADTINVYIPKQIKYKQLPLINSKNMIDDIPKDYAPMKKPVGRD